MRMEGRRQEAEDEEKAEDFNTEREERRHTEQEEQDRRQNDSYKTEDKGPSEDRAIQKAGRERTIETYPTPPGA